MESPCIFWIDKGYGGDISVEMNLDFGELITFFMLATALGMDAFSLGLGIGLNRLSVHRIMKISVTIGIFHVIMPLIGIISGYYLLTFIGEIARLIGGGLLVLLGVNMLWSAIIEQKEAVINYSSGIGLLILAFSVSVDALSIGFSLGLFSANVWLGVILFGFMGAFMTGVGLLLGNKLGRVVGDYGVVFGGLILLVFGLRFLV